MQLTALEFSLTTWTGTATFADGKKISIQGVRDCLKYWEEVRRIEEHRMAT